MASWWTVTGRISFIVTNSPFSLNNAFVKRFADSVSIPAWRRLMISDKHYYRRPMLSKCMTLHVKGAWQGEVKVILHHITPPMMRWQSPMTAYSSLQPYENWRQVKRHCWWILRVWPQSAWQVGKQRLPFREISGKVTTSSSTYYEDVVNPIAAGSYVAFRKPSKGFTAIFCTFSSA